MNKDKIKIAESTLKLLKKKSWDKISLNEVLSITKNIDKSINTKKELLFNINRYVDFNLKKQIASIEDSNPKDMLFELIMLRFDILQKHRESIFMLFNFYKSRPQQSISLIPSFLESMIVTAELANFNVNGLKGSLRLKGLFVIYLLTFYEWVGDNTLSLEKTMNALDKNLDQAEKFGKYLN